MLMLCRIITFLYILHVDVVNLCYQFHGHMVQIPGAAIALSAR